MVLIIIVLSCHHDQKSLVSLLELEHIVEGEG